MDQRRLIRLLLLLALAARAVFFLGAAQGAFPIGEGRTQADLAGNLLEGRGFMLSREMLYPVEERGANPMFQRTFEFYRRVDGYYGVLRPEQPTTFLVPGYAFFMAGVFAVFGSGDFLAVTGVQLLLGLLTVLIGIRIAGRFLKGKYLLAAGLFMALDPFELYYEAVPATQALFSLLFLLSILLSLKLIEGFPSISKTLFASILTAAAWASAFYVRPAALPIMLWLLVLLTFSPAVGRLLRLKGSVPGSNGSSFFSRKGAVSSVAVLTVFLILLLPWGLRNHAVSGTFRIMPTQGGVNLWEFNGRIFTEHFEHEARGAQFLYSDLRELHIHDLNSPELAEFPEFQNEPEWVRDSILYNRTLRFMLRNPLLTSRLISLRFIEFFKPFPLNSFSMFYTVAGLVSFLWVLIFLWGGAVRCAFHYGMEGFFISTTVAGYVLMHLLTASGTPHRIAIDYPMAILALCGIRYSILRYRSKRT